MKINRVDENVEILLKNNDKIIPDKNSLLGIICDKYLNQMEMNNILSDLIKLFLSGEISKEELRDINNKLQTVKERQT